MISAQRRELVIDYLRRNGGGSITEIAAALAASPSSIRRDLDFLAEAGAVMRHRGGAIIDNRDLSTFEPPAQFGAAMSSAEKAAIGNAAAQMLRSGQSVIFDSSSTVLEAARVAAGQKLTLTACTNDLHIAEVLAGNPLARLVVLGGTLREGSRTLVGDPGVSFLKQLHADIAFIGIHSLAGGRLSETSIELAAMKRQIIASAGRVVLLADSSKFAHPAFCDVCSLELIDAIVIDDALPESERTRLDEAGIEVVLVKA